MNIFEHIHIQGFRRLQDVSLKLKPLNVLIGANGSGKTSLLDVFALLSAAARGELKKAVSEFGGVDSLLTNLIEIPNGRAKALQFELDRVTSKTPPLRYSLSLVPQGVSYEIELERLAHVAAPHLAFLNSIRGHVEFGSNENPLLPLVRTLTGWNSFESALSQIDQSHHASVEFRHYLDSITYYHTLDVSPRAPVRIPQLMRDAQLPGENGEDLASCLYTIQQSDPDRFETIQDTLRLAFPNFDRLNFPPVAAGTLAMIWREKTSKHPFYMHQLSEGTLRFLWLVTLLYSPGLSAITIIDEPEVSLHPQLLSVLADCFRDASKRTQLIVATHADRLVRFLKPDEVIALDVDEHGAATATWADELDLDAWLEEYTLDQLWQHGRLGARP